MIGTRWTRRVEGVASTLPRWRHSRNQTRYCIILLAQTPRCCIEPSKGVSISRYSHANNLSSTVSVVSPSAPSLTSRTYAVSATTQSTVHSNRRLQNYESGGRTLETTRQGLRRRMLLTFATSAVCWKYERLEAWRVIRSVGDPLGALRVVFSTRPG
jgi:hypothetical protein